MEAVPIQSDISELHPLVQVNLNTVKDSTFKKPKKSKKDVNSKDVNNSSQYFYSDDLRSVTSSIAQTSIDEHTLSTEECDDLIILSKEEGFYQLLSKDASTSLPKVGDQFNQSSFSFDSTIYNKDESSAVFDDFDDLVVLKTDTIALEDSFESSQQQDNLSISFETKSYQSKMNAKMKRLSTPDSITSLDSISISSATIGSSLGFSHLPTIEDKKSLTYSSPQMPRSRLKTLEATSSEDTASDMIFSNTLPSSYLTPTSVASLESPFHVQPTNTHHHSKNSKNPLITKLPKLSMNKS